MNANESDPHNYSEALYASLVARMKELTSPAALAAGNYAEAQAIWAQIEAVKNRNGGMPPKDGDLRNTEAKREQQL